MQEIGLNKGIGYNEDTQQWYVATRRGAVYPWNCVLTTDREIMYFSTQFAAIAYLAENKGLTRPYVERFLREQAELEVERIIRDLEGKK